MTFGITNDHSRDVVQEKLLIIGNAVKDSQLFGKINKLDQIWLQIHIPSQITYPPTSITRFSSYFLFSNSIDRRGKKAIETFQKMFESCSVGDERGLAPQELKRKRSITVPKGSTISMDEELLGRYLSTGKLPDKSPNDVVAELKIHEKKEEFYFKELQLLAANTNDHERKAMSEDTENSKFHLVFELYLQRYPYEEI